jgi:hypothetical protein
MPNLSGSVSFIFGNVTVGGSAQLTHSYFDGTDPGCIGISWSHALSGPDAGQFSVVSDDGFSLATGGRCGGAAGKIVVKFSPTSGGNKTATLTLTGTMTNTPFVISLTGTGGVGGTLTLQPQTTNDFGVVKDGTASSPLNVQAINNSGSDVIVSAIAFNGDFSAGPGQPGLPFTLHANNADGAVNIPVIFTPTFTGFRITANAVSVTSSATNSPTSQSMQGTGAVIFPAFTVSGPNQVVLMAFVGAMGAISVLQVNANDLNCEEPGSFTRVYDWGMPLFEKYLGRAILRYEDNSAATFGCTVTATPVGRVSAAGLPGGGGANDGLIHEVFADLQVSGDLIQVAVSRIASQGPMEITEIFHEVDKRGEVVEGV